MIRTMGLDLSLTSTGVAAVEDGRLVRVAGVRSTGKKGDDLVARARRLDGLLIRIVGEVAAFLPAITVIEAPSYGSTMGSQHDRSGLWWLVVHRLQVLGYPVATVSPNGRAKYGTGKGNAGKDEVLAAVVRRYSSDTLEIKGNDQADAVLLAAMGSRKLGREVEVSLPATHLAAMDGAYWPAGLAVG